MKVGSSRLKLPRQIGLKRTTCTDYSVWLSYIKRLNGRSSLYTSLYSFDDLTREKSGRPNYDSAIMDCAWWDFDSNEEHTMESVRDDVATLISRLSGDVRLVFTGRGFHVYQPFIESVRGREWAHRLDRYERSMADGLNTLDGVGYPERLTRIPDTYNTKRGRWCVTVSPTAFVSDPQGFTPPERPDPAFLHLRPFTGLGEFEASFSLIHWVNDNPDPQVDSEVKDTAFDGLVGDLESIPIPTCLDRAIRVTNPPHHVRVALAQVLASNLRMFSKADDVPMEKGEEIVDSICGFISTLGWLDYNAAVTRRHVRSLMRYDRVPSPAWYRQHGLCDGKCWFCGVV